MSTDDRWADYLESASDDPELDPTALDGTARAALDRARETLADRDTWDGPPAGLEDRLLDLAAATPQDGLGAPEDGQRSRRTSGRGWVGRTGRWRILAVAATAAAAAAVFAIVVPQLGQQAPIEHYAMAGTALAPQATAAVDVESKVAGDAITLHITGLTAAPPGTYYAGWLGGPDRPAVPVGSFHWRKGGIPIELWSGVDTMAYPDFVITLQQQAQPPTQSDQVVLRGSLRP